MDDISGNERPSVRAGSAREVFAAFLKLGVTSIGGPIAHLGYFRDELVIRRRWIDDSGFAELLALCQFLPGPAAAAGMLVLASPVTQIGFIALGALSGLLVCTPKVRSSIGNGGWIPTRRASFLMLTGAATILLLLPVAGRGGSLFELAGIFYRAGALVFGGGHVVLPLLHAELVPGFVDDTAFLTGYGAAQALPGPLFALSAYLGAVGSPDAPLAGGLIAIVAIFLPGLLLVAGALPFRAAIAKNARAQAAIMGVNAVVVGILAAALYDPLWTSGVKSFADALIVGVGLLIVLRFRCPPLALVAGNVGAALALAVI